MPFGLLHDEAHKVVVYLDKSSEGKLIYVHPDDNSTSVLMESGDLVSLIREQGTTVRVVDIKS
jgi:Ala-tRNA(Pro) deacylase